MRVALAAREAPGGHVLVGRADRVHHLVDADAERGQRVRLDLHQDLPRHPAVDVDARDARHVLERLDDRLVGERGELAQVGVVGDITASETIGCWFSLSARMTSGSLTSRGKPGRTCAILSRTSCIAASCRSSRRNSTKTWLVPFAASSSGSSFTPDTVLIAYSIGLRDVGLDRLRRRARVLRLHEHERQADVGHLLDAQPVYEKRPSTRDADHHHRGEDRVVDRDAGDPHGQRSPRSGSGVQRARPASGRTSAPTRRRARHRRLAPAP